MENYEGVIDMEIELKGDDLRSYLIGKYGEDYAKEVFELLEK